MLHLFFYVNFKRPLKELELQRVESFTMDQFGRRYSWKDVEEDRGEKKVSFGTCGHGLSLSFKPAE